MCLFKISSDEEGEIGVFEGEDEDEALDDMARAGWFESFDDLVAEAGGSVARDQVKALFTVQRLGEGGF